MIHFVSQSHDYTVAMVNNQKIDLHHEHQNPLVVLDDFDRFWSNIDGKPLASLLRRLDNYTSKRVFWDKQDFLDFFADKEVYLQAEWSSMNIRFLRDEDALAFDERLRIDRRHKFVFTKEQPYQPDEMNKFLSELGIVNDKSLFDRCINAEQTGHISIRTDHHATLFKIKFAIQGNEPVSLAPSQSLSLPEHHSTLPIPAA